MNQISHNELFDIFYYYGIFMYEDSVTECGIVFDEQYQKLL